MKITDLKFKLKIWKISDDGIYFIDYYDNGIRKQIGIIEDGDLVFIVNKNNNELYVEILSTLVIEDINEAQQLLNYYEDYINQHCEIIP
ncbi:hypothetical protein [Photorhabdus luminescens]|uniref:hypothetical protein n=1 Tax=Photorhabdus luminescens TaxID=29488 RepID=UPI00223EE3B8|nr:hypothetical protein [Photorhabdus luminescens]MCW7764476.1 hypothetical protein [Photorhabdus luminescens subsp. venezuelensis]